MKTKAVCILLFLWVGCIGIAQNLQVQYEEVISMGKPKIDTDNEEVAALIASQLKDIKSEKVLLFDQGKSLYKPLEKQAADEALSPNTSGIKFTMKTGGTVIYKNQEAEKMVKQDYIMDRLFLITDSLPSIVWELADETKEILGYVCRKAVSEKNIVAWYATDLPVNAGPSVFHGLPGLILSIENKSLIIEAQSIEVVADLTEKIREPSEGKKISQEAFDKLKMKKMEELGGSSKEGEGVQIKVIQM